MKNHKIIFSPLGGGQKVGASCYYLQFGKHHVLFDAGIDTSGGNTRGPVWSHLLQSSLLYSMEQIDQIYISHAHMDHIGFLFQMMSTCPEASVHMTELTKSLAELQIYERIYLGNTQISEKKRLTAQGCLDRITVVPYMKTMEFPDYKVTFYHAGHIPGAMMTLIEYQGRSILYTGDYSISASPLCEGCMIPSDKNIDTVILCGLHAKHPNYQKHQDALFQNIHNIFDLVRNRRVSVQCTASQLSKGVEFLKLLNEHNSSGIPIYVDEGIMQVVRKMEHSGFQIWSEYNKPIGELAQYIPCICLTSGNKRNRYCSQKWNVDFTLHEDFQEMKQFIKQINPRHVYLVHCAKPFHEGDTTIEQVLMMDGSCRTQFTFAQEQEIYYL